MIESICLPERVLQYFAVQEALSLAESEQRFDELVDYLDRCVVTRQPVCPSMRVDAAWHTFVLHTKQYAEFCQERYGRFIHHNPFPLNTRDLEGASIGVASCNDGGGTGNCSNNCGVGDCNSGGDGGNN